MTISSGVKKLTLRYLYSKFGADRTKTDDAPQEDAHKLWNLVQYIILHQIPQFLSITYTHNGQRVYNVFNAK